ncbi:MAG: sulfite exporter TauE/SafE family protein [Actinomycetota bacterium]|nr:sulfite exporter TauE/SafE family protein [Actinomycetota bacterium]
MLAIAIAAGIVIGLSLGALGGGGSILTVPVLVYALGQQPQEATTASLVIVGITAITAAVGHARAGRVQWRAAGIFGVLGVAASFGGSTVNRLVDPQVLLLAFAALMIVAAIAMFARTGADALDAPGEAADGGRPRGVGAAARVVVTALVVGFLTGFLGVGGGFLIVPALVLALGFTMPVAVGTSLVVISVTSLGAFVERLGNGGVPWDVVVPFTLAAIAGSLLGKRVADRISGPTLTRAFATLLVLVAGYVAVRAAGAV